MGFPTNAADTGNKTLLWESLLTHTVSTFVQYREWIISHHYTSTARYRRHIKNNPDLKESWYFLTACFLLQEIKAQANWEFCYFQAPIKPRCFLVCSSQQSTKGIHRDISLLSNAELSIKVSVQNPLAILMSKKHATRRSEIKNQLESVIFLQTKKNQKACLAG